METSLSVSFKTGGEGDPISLSAELDSVRNEEETRFAFNTGVCWINVFGSMVQGPTAAAPNAVSSLGNISGGQIVMVEREDKITMENKAWFKRTALSSQYGIELLSASFIGTGSLGSLSHQYLNYGDDEPGSVFMNSGGILLGELTVKYKTMTRLYKITNVPKPEGYDNEENPGVNVIALFSQYGSKATTSATFKNIGVDAPRRVRLKVVNHCSDDPVPGAVVTLGGGLPGGVTGSDGMIDLGMVAPGTYDVIDIVASGFEPPASDTLDNEEIDIPSEEPA